MKDLRLFEQLVLIGILLLVFLGVFYLLRYLQERNYLKYLRGEHHEGGTQEGNSLLQNKNTISLFKISSHERGLPFFGKKDARETAEYYYKLFDRAGLRTNGAPVIYFVVKTLCVLFCFASFFWGATSLPFLSAQVLWLKLLLLLAYLFLGFRAFDYYLDWRVFKRYRAIKRDITSALDLLSICVNAGLSLEKSFERIADEIGIFNPELGKELALTGTELTLLPDRRRALLNLSERVNIPLMNAVVTTLIQSEEQGTSIATSLRVLASSYVKERLLEIETQAARLPAILTVPMILFILPSLFIVILGPSIIQVLTYVR